MNRNILRVMAFLILGGDLSAAVIQVGEKGWLDRLVTQINHHGEQQQLFALQELQSRLNQLEQGEFPFGLSPASVVTLKAALWNVVEHGKHMQTNFIAIQLASRLKDERIIPIWVEKWILQYDRDKFEKDGGFPQVRRTAAYAIGAFGPRILSSIEPYLTHTDPLVRAAMAQAISTWPGEAMTDRLIAYLDDEHSEVKFNALHALLGRKSPKALVASARLVSDADPVIAMAATWLIGLAGPEAIPVLIDQLSRSDEAVRMAGVFSLALLGPRAMPFLIDAIQTGSLERQRGAFFALSQMPEVNFPWLMEGLRHQDPDIRRLALDGLGAHGDDPRTLPAVWRMLDDAVPAVRAQAIGLASDLEKHPLTVLVIAHATSDAEAAVRLAAIHGLKKLQDPESAPALRQAVKDTDPLVREEAWSVLAEFHDPFIRSEANAAKGTQGARPAFEQNLILLSHVGWPVRLYAAETLAGLEDPRTVAPLMRLMDDPREEVRLTAMTAAARWRDPAILPSLDRRLDGSPREKRQALIALSGFGSSGMSLWARVFEDRDLARQEAYRIVCATSDLGMIPFILEILKEDERMYHQMAWGSLLRFGAKAVPVLRRVLKNEVDLINYRWRIVEILVQLKDEAVVSDLVDFLEGPVWSASAFQVLGNLKEIARPAVPALLPFLESPYLNVRRLARDALAQIDPEPLRRALLALTKNPDPVLKQEAESALKTLPAR